MLTTDFDIIVNGGGMAGITFALLVSQQAISRGEKPLRIAIIEASALNYGDHPGFDGRAIALAAGSIDIYRRNRLWPRLAAYAEPISQIHVSDRGHLGQVTIQAKDYQRSALGAVIELMHAGRELYQQLAVYPNISVFCPCRLAQIVTTQEAQQVILDDGRQLTARLLVGADGGRSAVASELHIDSQQLDYGQSAIIANVVSADLHQQRAFERFTEHGPVALLPMTEGRWSLVWCVPRAQQQYWLTASESQFLKGLQQAFGYRVGEFQRVGKREGYPLILTQRQQLIAHRCAVIGNAAHSLHPIAGQGFNLGIRDAALLAEQVCLQSDPGAMVHLLRYRQLRQSDITHTVGLTSALAFGFSSRDKISVIARNMGLVMMQHCSFLKNKLVQQTLGFVEHESLF
ncbi:2-octaprenyl-6-methoxyphenyl hydroxylase [Celerinatantimonas sp. YJH-8]|uniref:2-octaprenyl-6-methoxyphenyl hydroxylase n=1 Tax=Celerinatantimonas sp. YJH-8 TaxID=3228714 RepID=UPI0038C9DD8D